MTLSFFEIRLFYVRIFPCSIESAPPYLTLSHLRRPLGVRLEINGSKIPSSDQTSIKLRRDRIDRDTSEVTYVSTDGVKVTGAVDFEVVDDQGNLILCGSLEKLEAAWSNGSIGSCGDKNPKTGWSMDCYLAASISGSGFVQPNVGIVNPSIEVYVAGCFGGVPLILTQTVQLSPRRKARPGKLDSIPEDEESAERENGLSEGLVCRRVTTSTVSEGESNDGYESDIKIDHAYCPEGWYVDEDGQLSWFNAGVRVGVGLGLGMCVGIGIGVGLIMRSYQATTKTFKRRFF